MKMDVLKLGPCSAVHKKKKKKKDHVNECGAAD